MQNLQGLILDDRAERIRISEDFDEKIYTEDIPNATSTDLRAPVGYNNGHPVDASAYYRRVSYDGLIHATRAANLYTSIWFSYSVVVVLPYDYEKEPFCLPGKKTVDGGMIYGLQSVSLTEVEDVRERFKSLEDCRFEFPLEPDTSYVGNPISSCERPDAETSGMVSDDGFRPGRGVHQTTESASLRGPGTATRNGGGRHVGLLRGEAECYLCAGQEGRIRRRRRKIPQTPNPAKESKRLYHRTGSHREQDATDIEITDENYDPDFNTPAILISRRLSAELLR